MSLGTHSTIEVIWLLRHLRPDFKTIADFRRCRAALKEGHPQTRRVWLDLCGDQGQLEAPTLGNHDRKSDKGVTTPWALSGYRG
jgi:hypothetical protein